MLTFGTLKFFSAAVSRSFQATPRYRWGLVSNGWALTAGSNTEPRQSARSKVDGGLTAPRRAARRWLAAERVISATRAGSARHGLGRAWRGPAPSWFRVTVHREKKTDAAMRALGHAHRVWR
jgi:hypothetical protein